MLTRRALLGTLATSSYSPGLVTGLLLYLPVGFAAVSQGRRVVTPRAFQMALLFGVLIHAAVAVIAFA